MMQPVRTNTFAFVLMVVCNATSGCSDATPSGPGAVDVGFDSSASDDADASHAVEDTESPIDGDADPEPDASESADVHDTIDASEQVDTEDGNAGTSDVEQTDDAGTTADAQQDDGTIQTPDGHEPADVTLLDCDMIDCIGQRRACIAMTESESAVCGDCLDGFAESIEGICVNINECAEDTDGCVDERSCIDTEGAYECGDCPAGFTNQGDFACADVDECTDGEHGCANGRPCINLDGSYTCGDCAEGLVRDGEYACADVDECTGGEDACTDGRICINVYGSYECGDCPQGYVDNGAFACTDVDECLTEFHECAVGRPCVNTEGGYTCGDCPQGFANDGEFACSDIDECAAEHACVDGRPCINLFGTYSCGECPDGYLQTGEFACADIDECAVGTHGCTGDRDCVNTLGSYTCGTCPDGYAEDGEFACADINECMANTDGCTDGRPCINEDGSYRCGACAAGYTSNGAFECTDIDECVAGSDACEDGRPCVNAPGSYSCGACPGGYMSNGAFRCADIDECVERTDACIDGRACINTVGSYRCGACSPGFVENGNYACRDVNECAVGTGPCDGLVSCENLEGAYRCTACPTGYADGTTMQGEVCELPTHYTERVGRDNPTPYESRCPAGSALWGINGRWNSLGGVAEFNLVCRTMDYAAETGSVLVGSQTSLSPVGGPGGGASNTALRSCPGNSFVSALSIFLGYSRNDIYYLNALCSDFARVDTPNGSSLVRRYTGTAGSMGALAGYPVPLFLECPHDHVAVGVFGQDAGTAPVDSIGLICEPMHLLERSGGISQDCYQRGHCDYRVAIEPAAISPVLGTAPSGTVAFETRVTCPRGQVLSGLTYNHDNGVFGGTRLRCREVTIEETAFGTEIVLDPGFATPYAGPSANNGPTFNCDENAAINSFRGHYDAQNRQFSLVAGCNRLEHDRALPHGWAGVATNANSFLPYEYYNADLDPAFNYTCPVGQVAIGLVLHWWQIPSHTDGVRIICGTVRIRESGLWR